MAAWLWARSRLHRSWDLALLEQEVMSSVQLNKFVLLTQQDRPAGY
jgi:hemolysin-activating ACP:hemolysin acyltransferase